MEEGLLESRELDLQTTRRMFELAGGQPGGRADGGVERPAAGAADPGGAGGFQAALLRLRTGSGTPS